MTELTKIEQQDDTMRPADPMVSMIERVAMDPSVPLDRLEKMLQLKADHEELEDKKAAAESERRFNRALSECQAEMPIVGKNRRNDHTRATYTDLAGLLAVVGPIIARHGFAVQFNPGRSPDAQTIAVEWTQSHADGHSRSGVAYYPIDAAGTGGKSNKTPIQAQASSRTYARRYLMIDLFNIATSDDSDGNTQRGPEPKITEDQFREIRSELARTGVNESVMLQAAGVDEIVDLTEKKAEGLLKTLRKKPDAEAS